MDWLAEDLYWPWIVVNTGLAATVAVLGRRTSPTSLLKSQRRTADTDRPCGGRMASFPEPPRQPPHDSHGAYAAGIEQPPVTKTLVLPTPAASDAWA